MEKSIYDNEEEVKKEVKRIEKWNKENKITNVNCYDDKISGGL